MSAAKIGVAVVLAMGSWSAAAAADDTAPVKKDGVYYFKEIVVPGRSRPAAAIDVARVVARAPLPALRQSMVDRIGKAVEKAPF